MAAATDPVFTDTPKVWPTQVSATADGTPTARAPTGGATTMITGTTDGVKVEKIVYQGIDPALDPCVVNLWLHDGSTYYLIDQVKFLGTDGTTTAPCERFERSYDMLLVPTGFTLRQSCTVASQLIDIVAFGGEF